MVKYVGRCTKPKQPNYLLDKVKMMGLAFNILAQQMSHYGYSIHQIDADHYQLVALNDCESSSSELVSREQLLQRLEGLQRQIAED